MPAALSPSFISCSHIRNHIAMIHPPAEFNPDLDLDAMTYQFYELHDWCANVYKQWPDVKNADIGEDCYYLFVAPERIHAYLLNESFKTRLGLDKWTALLMTFVDINTAITTACDNEKAGVVSTAQSVLVDSSPQDVESHKMMKDCMRRITDLTGEITYALELAAAKERGARLTKVLADAGFGDTSNIDTA